jgi:hypothetical protein
MSTPATPPVPPKKGTENLALMISIIALIVSGISLWEGHDAVKIQRAVAKPVPTVLRADISSHIMDNDPLYHSLTMAVTVDHMGVKIKEVVIKPEVMVLKDDDPLKTCFKDMDNLTFNNPDAKLNIDAGGLSVTDVPMPFPASCKNMGEWTFVGDAIFKGEDDSGHSYDSHEYPTVFNAKVKN